MSGTPGKTRMMNVYHMPVRGEWYVVDAVESRTPEPHGQQPRTTHHAFYFLDLPGYGYARASQTERRAFRLLITHALERPALTGVLWLLDIRREPSDDDRAMHDLFAGRGTRILAALTKSDKLSRSERLSREDELLATLALDPEQVIATSAEANEGIDELREAVAGLVGRPPEVS